MELKRVRDIVEDCLKEQPLTRDSDWVLYEAVFNKMGFNCRNCTLHEMVNMRNNIPTFESVTRARRYIQSFGQYLPSDRVERKRYEKQNDYIKTYGRRG